jgi:hypothetical protein
LHKNENRCTLFVVAHREGNLQGNDPDPQTRHDHNHHSGEVGSRVAGLVHLRGVSRLSAKAGSFYLIFDN